MYNEFWVSSKLTDEESKDLQESIESKKMDSISFYDFELDFFKKEIMEDFLKYDKIKKLSFEVEDNKIQSLEFLEKILLRNQVEILFLNLVESEMNQRIFKALKGCTSLKDLTMKYLFREKELKTLRKLINRNQNLETININHWDTIEENIDLIHLTKDLNSNNSLKNLTFNQQHITVNDYSFLQKFNALTHLNLQDSNTKLSEILKNITLKTNPNMKSIYIDRVQEESDYNFSSTSLSEIYLKSRPKYVFMTNFMKGVKYKTNIKILDINYCQTKLERKTHPFFEWVKDFKEFLMNNKNLNTLKCSIPFNPSEWKYVCEGLEKNVSLKVLDVCEVNIGDQAQNFGNCLKTKKDLKELFIGGDTISDFMFEFQNIESLTFLYLFNCNINDECGKYLSNLILNNRDLKQFKLYNITISIEAFEMICKALESHKKVSYLYIITKSSLSLKCLTQLIQYNHSIKKITLENVKFFRDEYIDFLKILSKNTMLKSISVTQDKENQLNSHELTELTEDFLFFNYTLTFYQIGDLSLTKCMERNEKFISNYYQVQNLKKDLYFQFE